MNGLQGFQVPFQVDRIFFGGDEGFGASLFTKLQQLAYVLCRVAMMVAKAAGAGEHNSRRA